ncbi:MAG: FadR family transcriptional regulator [Sedimentisphaerales bacterium]|nr:FadR family transcriptional regulator [Sedimentisphaerales bacterium]
MILTDEQNWYILYTNMQLGLDKELLAIKVVRRVIALIASGEYAVGMRLPAERRLCEDFGVSRGTLRKGLSDLEKLGVIEIRVGSGSYVKAFSSRKLPKNILPPEYCTTSLEDIVYARKTIESAAIELACERITSKQLDILKDFIEQMADALDNLPEFLRLDMLFHQQVVQSSGNAALATAFEAISAYHQYSQVFTSLHEGEEEVALDYHRRMLLALQQGDKHKARMVIAEHLDNMVESAKTD